MVNQAINSKEFSSILSEINFICEDNPHVAICVSGGADSIALLLLMRAWIRKVKGNLTVIHFNHKLRKESLLEAKFVREISKKLNVNYKVLEWNEKKPQSSIMKYARDARYKKIIEFCKKKKILTLMTAHHFNDALETFVMRKHRRFSTLGLNSIPMKNNQYNLQIIRPLINIEKKRLVQTCIENKINWLNDPSNKNDLYERVRIRKLINNLNDKNLSNLILDFKTNLKKNNLIETEISKFFVENLIFYDYAMFSIKKNEFLNRAEFLKLEILKKILVTCSGTIYPPRISSIQNLIKKLVKDNQFKHSIHSCIVKVSIDYIEVYREYQKIKKTTPNKILLKKMSSFFWDNRFIIKTYSKDLVCYLMNEKIWLNVKEKYKMEKRKRGINFQVLKTIPVLKFDNKFIIPFLGSRKELNKNEIKVMFHPTIPLTKKNF